VIILQICGLILIKNADVLAAKEVFAFQRGLLLLFVVNGKMIIVVGCI